MQQTRPLLSSSSPSKQRQTVITSNAKAPLESVVIRNSNVNNDNEGISVEAGAAAAAAAAAATTTMTGGGGTNVRVCIRLRPMLLPSDFEMTSTTETSSPVIISPRSKPPMGMVQAKGSSLSGMRRHSSGLATPTRNTTTTNTINEQQTPGGAAMSSWQTHPTDPRRITQSIHTTAHTSHRDPERLADYDFDRVFGPTESTTTLYQSCVRSVIESFVEGYHGSVFAYGQTNSGKTHTMTGNLTEPGVVRLAVNDIFHRIRSPTSQTVATTSNNNATTTTTNNETTYSTGSREYLVRVSYLEIYNEQIYDLLSQTNNTPTTRPSLGSSSSTSSSSLQHHHLPPSTSVRIFESRTEGVVVRGLREEIVTCPNDVFALLDAGDARRRIGSTGMNRTSSRSHTVFRLVLESRASSSKTKHKMNGEGGGGKGVVGASSGIPSLIPSSSNSSVNSHDSDSVSTSRSSNGTPSSNIKGPVRISSLSLVDLAGSESVKATGSTGVRQKEGQYINKSLLTLGHVVHKLSEMSSRVVEGGGTGTSSSSSSLSMMGPNEHIPYRDSKLTRLLQPSLGGNARICIICNISPALCNLEESHNTLKFAMRAKRIRQHARITEVADEKTLLRSYREEIEELKRQLKEARQTVDEAVIEQQQQQQQQQTKVKLINTPDRASYFSSSDEEDNDDAQVLVSAIANGGGEK
jgi:centromeric protein E